MRWCRRWLASCAVILSCGDAPEVATELAFQVAEDVCDQPGLQAYLQVTGIPGICPLTVNPDRTIEGRCAPIPTGAIRDVRLVYYIVQADEEVRLATATVQVDLRDVENRSVRVNFNSSMLVTSFDDDEDGQTNLDEFCVGTDPRQPG